MSAISQSFSDGLDDDLEARLRMLTAAQVLRIDELLNDVGDYGEVHLVVQRRQLRYINQVQSYKAPEEAAPPKK
jgi:hypothetical protein